MISTRLYTPGEKPSSGHYRVVGPKGGIIKERGHRDHVVKITNDRSSKLPPTPKPNQKYLRIK
jgi:hypothetical protein